MITIKVTALNHAACRVGWLLACDAPANIAKGERMLARLSDKSQLIALAYRDQCLEAYAALASSISLRRVTEARDA